MLNGIYQVNFQTPLGVGSGVIVLQDGAARGGDSAMYYHGSYSETDGTISAQIKIGRHESGPSVLGVSNATLNLSGKAASDQAANLSGTAPEAPGVQLRVGLKRLAA